jgi:integrase
MFDGLNDEARRIIYLIIETGLRLSEACALTRKNIHTLRTSTCSASTAHGFVYEK